MSRSALGTAGALANLGALYSALESPPDRPHLQRVYTPSQVSH